jgi:terminase small subunit / prophage DNA-packing protein
MEVNQRQLSEIFGVSTVTLLEWQREGMPYAPAATNGLENQYDTVQCIAWYAKRSIDKAGANSSRDRLDEVRAQREQLALERDLGRVIYTDDVEPAFSDYVLGLDQVLSGIPERYVGLLEQQREPEEIYRLLKTAMDEVRGVASDYEHCTQVARAKAQASQA